MARRGTAIALTLTFVTTVAAQAAANPASDTLRQRATEQLYNLDDQLSLDTWRQATAADPQDAAAWRGLAGAVMARIAMLRGNVTVDSYLGRVGSRDVNLPPPPPELAREFSDAVTRAITIARQRVSTHPDDAAAQYELGAAVGIRASYIATVEGGIIAAFRAAREAYDAHETVLKLNPARADAGLIVGTYRYIVAALSLPVRMFAYIAGFGGGKERGIGLVEAAASYPGDNQSDARLALLLMYTRERRFDDALKQLDALRAKYPRNRLLWLESGSTLLRADRPADADRVLTEGMDRLARDSRPRMYGEEALWYYRRGTARAALGRTSDARQDLEKSIAVDGRPWVHGRAHLEVGKLLLKSNVAEARQHLQLAAQLGDSDRDGASADRARELLKSATGR
jgi:tetratricopeptide (TPR) repeat protein